MTGVLRAVILIVTLLMTYTLDSHPSYGLIITKSGDIYFSDVLHHGGAIWKLDQGGRLHPVLTGEHCHFIYQDVNGRIWGTNHEYLERTESNRNSLWYIDNNGKKQMYIAPTGDMSKFSGVNFVVDSQGRVIYNYQKQLYRRTSDNTIEQIVPDTFGRIMSLQMDHRDHLYIVDNSQYGGCVFEVSHQGHISILADSLLDVAPENPPFPEDRFNMFYAGSVDDEGGFYLANMGSRRITHIHPNGKISHIYHSEPPWYPVAFQKFGDHHVIMESGYLPGKGNFGPRLILASPNGQRVIADTDQPDKIHEPWLNHKTSKKISRFYMIGMLIMVPGLAWLGYTLFRQ